MSDNIVIDDIIDNMTVDDVLEEREIIENPVIELEMDNEFEVLDKREQLQDSYNEYSDSYIELTELLGTIIKTGEYTEENKQQVININEVYDEKYETIVKQLNKAKKTIEDNKSLDFNGSVLMNTQDDVFNALTKNGEVQAIYRDSEGKIYINAQYLQTRGLRVVNDDGETTLYINEQGNLTTSGDIVGGTIMGADIIGSTFSSTSGDFKVLNDGTVDATSLSVNDEISTDTLTVQKINNSKYQSVLDKNVTINIDPLSSNSVIFENGATYKSVSAFLDACPRNLNGYTVLLNLKNNLTENIEIDGLHSGAITLQLNEKTIYGYVYLTGETIRYRIYGNTSDTANGSKFGSIMPNLGMSQTGGYYSLVMHSTQGFVYDLKIYGGNSTTDNNIGARIGDWGNVYLSNMQFIGCYNALRAYNVSKAYIASSKGTTISYAYSAYHGSQVVLNPTTQTGKAGATSHVYIGNNSTVTTNGVTWSSTASSGSNTNTETTKTEKTVTINSTLGDTYRSTVYNNWKQDSTVRQGDYGYGDCEGIWIYGNQFADYQNKEITKVEITIKRQAGGVSSAVTHTLKMHNYTTKPTGRPSFSSSFSKNFSLAVNNTITVALTTADEINAFKSNKGFGLSPIAQSSTYYSVCSGSAEVKITYKE